MKNEESVYFAERVRATLAADPDVAELGIEVLFVGGRVVLRGTVTSDRRKEQVLALVQRLCPGLEIDDDLRIEVLREPKAESV